MWRPIDTEFYSPRLPVGIIGLPGGDASGLRQILEALQCVVHVHWIGTPGDFLKVISQGAAVPRYLFIDGHGGEEGLHFGEYGVPEIDTSMLVGEYMPADAVRDRVNLPECTVINLTCMGGMRRMADAFLAGKVRAYIGCRDYPDGTATDLFVTNLVYNLRMRNLSDRDAWYRAVADTDHPDIDLFSYYNADGNEERFIRNTPERIHA